MMRRGPIAWIALVIWGLASSAQATEAETIRRIIADGLSAYLAFVPDDTASFEVAVSGESAPYRVEINDVRIGLEGGERRLDFGSFGFSLTPLGDSLYRISDLASPGSVRLVDGTGQSRQVASYSVRASDVTWHAGIWYLFNGELELYDVRAVTGEPDMALSLPSMTLRSQGLVKSDGSIDLKGWVEGTHFTIKGAEGWTAAIDRTYLEFDGDDWNAAAISAYMDRYMRGLAAIRERELTPEARMAAITVLVGQLPIANVYPPTFGERFGFSGLAVGRADGEQIFKLDGLEFGLGAQAQPSAPASATLGLKMNGFAFGRGCTCRDAPALALLPRDLELVLEADGVPWTELWNSYVRSLPQLTNARNEAEMESALQTFGPDILAAVLGSATRLSLPKFLIETPVGRVALDGVLDVDAAAAGGVKGVVNMTLSNLDRAITVAGQSTSESGAMLLGMMQFLKSLALREQDAEGGTVDRLVAELTADGQFLINDQPFGALPGPIAQ